MKEIPHQKDSQTGVPASWTALKAFTGARIALGRTGTSVPLSEWLAFKLAHAHARDAVYSKLELEHLQEELLHFNLGNLLLHSQVQDRLQYIHRPDLGRRLDQASREKIIKLKPVGYDIAIVLADGLSAAAINNHTLPLLRLLIPMLQKAGFTIAPLTIVEQGRVAIGDEIGDLFQAKLMVILIGERPGLSAPESMGAYITFNPKPGTTDEARNCISNIRPEGLPYTAAAEKLLYLLKEALRRKLTGVALKDQALLNANPTPPALER